MSRLDDVLYSTAFGYNDSPESIELAKKQKYQALRYNSLNEEANQAKARGLITEEEYKLWQSGENANFIQRALGLTKGKTGGMLETAIDIMSLGNYASAAFMNGLTDYAAYGKGAGLDLGNFKFGFSPAAARKSWRNSYRYQEMLGKYGVDIGFLGGLAGDIFLDPTTYMTFGVGAGARVVARQGLKIGSKVMAEGAELTISKFGRNVYRYAAKDLETEFAEDMAKEAHLRYYMASEKLHMLDRELAAKWQQRIAEHMVNNFDRLKVSYLKEKLGTRVGKSIPGKAWYGIVNFLEKSAPYLPGTDAWLEKTFRPFIDNVLTADISTGAGVVRRSGIHQAITDALQYKVDDIFEETATALNKNRGISNLFGLAKTNYVNTTLAGLPIISKAYDLFDRGWNVPSRYLEARRLHQFEVSRQSKNYSNEYIKNLGTFTTEERTAISHYVEQREVWEKTGQGTLPGVVPLTPKMRNAVSYFNKEMDSILEAEKAAGLNIGRIENYVSHIYANPSTRRMVLETISRNDQELIRSGNRFVQQRLIATLMDVEDKFGKGSVLTDSLEILSRRRYASVQAIENTKFLDFVRREYGVGQQLIEGLKRSAEYADTLMPWLRRVREGGDNFTLYSVEQMWRESKGKLTRLGFKEGNLDHNTQLLDYLQTPLSERKAHVFESSANEEAKLYYILKGDAGITVLPKNIKIKVPANIGLFRGKATLRRKPGGLLTEESELEFSVTSLLKALNDKEDPLWDFLPDDIRGVTSPLNAYFKKHLDSSIEAFVPEIRATVKENINVVYNRKLSNIRATTPEARYKAVEDLNNRRRTALNNVDKTFDEYATVEVRDMEAVLPQELIDAANASRWRVGDVSSHSPVTTFQLEQITELARGLKLTAGQMSDILPHLLGKREMKTMREADLLIDLLKGNKFNQDDFVKVNLKFPVRETDPYIKDVPTEAIPVGSQPIRRQVVRPDVKRFRATGELNEEVNRTINRTISSTKGAGRLSPNEADLNYAASRLLRDKKITDELHRDFQDYQSLKKITARKEQIRSAIRNRTVLTQEQELARSSSNLGVKAAENKLAGMISSRDELIRQIDSLEARAAKHKNPDQAGALRDKATKLRADIDTKNALILSQQDRISALNSKIASKPDVSVPRGKGTKQELAELKKLKQDYDALLGRRLIKDVEINYATVRREANALLSDMPSNRQIERKLAYKNKPPAPIAPDVKGPLKLEGDELYSPNFNKEYEHNIYLPKSIADDIASMNSGVFDPTMNSALRRLLVGYDAVQQAYKTYLMAPIAGFYSRNFMTNVAMNYLRTGLEIFKGDFVPALNYVLRKDTGIGGYEELGREIITTRTGRQISIEELYTEMSRRGILTGFTQDAHLEQFTPEGVGLLKRALNTAGGAAFGQMAGSTADAAIGDDTGYGSTIGLILGALVGYRKRPGGAQPGLLNAASYTVQSGFTPFLRLGELTTEIPTRVAMFVSEFRRTDSLSEAAHAVYNHMNDWTNLSVFEKRFMRRAMPFYSWTKLAVKQTLNTFTSNKMRDLTKTIHNWNETQHANDPEDVPDWLHNKLTLVAGKHILVSPGLPIEDVSNMLQGILPKYLPGERLAVGAKDQKELYREFVGRIGFGVQPAIELLTGQDSFTGKEIATNSQGSDYKHAPWWMKKLIGYTKTKDGVERVNPKMAWVLGEIPFSRLLGVSRSVFEDQNPSNLNYKSLARNILGVSIYKRDTKTNKLYIDKARLDAMERLLHNVGQIKRYEGFVDFDKKD